MSSATGTLARPDPTAARGMRVLLVEDTDAVRRAVGLGLRSSGFKGPGRAGRGGRARRLRRVAARGDHHGLSMPVTDGFELIATLRVREIDVPILVITARDSVRDRAAAAAAGADGYLLKPFGLAALCDAVTVLADRQTVTTVR